jgi:hypothetical protein
LALPSARLRAVSGTHQGQEPALGLDPGDERGAGYVKRNAISGHVFISWAALEAHLDWWMREIADRRAHGTTGEAPLVRFQREEASALKALDGRPPFRQMRELVRRVQADCAVAVDANSYSVPWRLIGESVQVVVADGRARILHAGQEVAVHAETTGRRQRIIDPAHFHGVTGVTRPVTGAAPALATLPEPALLRPLADVRPAGAGHDHRSRGLTELSDAAQADCDPRPARQPVGRSGQA